MTDAASSLVDKVVNARDGMKGTVMYRFAVAAALLSCTTPSVAASIMVQSTSQDTVGQSIVYNLRNEIARSALHKVAYTRKDAGFIINIVTLEQNDGRSTVYSASLLMPPFDRKGFDYFVTSAVGFCGSSRAQSCASDILSTFDEDITRVVEGLTEALRAVPKQ